MGKNVDTRETGYELTMGESIVRDETRKIYWGSEFRILYIEYRGGGSGTRVNLCSLLKRR
jgi:hypothetical protein